MSALQQVRDGEFEQQVLQSDVPVLVDFYADWCGPCRALGPVLEEVAQSAGHAKVVKVNVDESPQLAAQYSVSSIPTLVVFREGEVASRHTGLATAPQLQGMLAS